MGQKPFDPIAPIDDWEGINKMREVLGMPPVGDKKSPCRDCKKDFWTTVKLGRAQQFYCPRCRENISKQDRGFIDYPVRR